MNVDNILDEVIPTDFGKHDRLDMIFIRQHALMEKYVPIEVSNNLCHTTDCPVDINDKFGQARLKDFFWRVTEELTEAAEAQRIHPELKNHTLEELADALHFLVEACLLANIKSTDFKVCLSDTTDKLVDLCEDTGIPLDVGCFEVIYWLGAASNCLKNRPWKQNHQLVDVTKFYGYMITALPVLLRTFSAQGVTGDEIFRMYWKKSEVNKFRQRSNY